MAEFTEYKPGTFCWVDTGTVDPEASKAFYISLFGWEGADTPTPDGRTYTTYSKDGRAVAGGSALPPEVLAMGVPPHWTSYVAVENVSDTLEKIALAGGYPMGPPIEIPGAGTMGMFTDPVGAPCAVWQAGEHIGAGLANEPGSLIWNELMTTDPGASAAFYRAVFGWEHSIQEMPTGEYHLFSDGDEMRAGMLKITPEMGEMPPSWTVYFAVADIEESIAKVRTLGGRVEAEIMDVPGVGKMAVTADPTGAYFMIMESVAS